MNGPLCMYMGAYFLTHLITSVGPVTLDNGTLRSGGYRILYKAKAKVYTPNEP